MLGLPILLEWNIYVLLQTSFIGLSLSKSVLLETVFLGRAPHFWVRSGDTRGNVNSLLYCANAPCLSPSLSPSCSVYLVWLWCIWTWLHYWRLRKRGFFSQLWQVGRSCGKFSETESNQRSQLIITSHFCFSDFLTFLSPLVLLNYEISEMLFLHFL